MNTRRIVSWAFLFLLHTSLSYGEVLHTYLTWMKKDTTTSMTVNYHTGFEYRGAHVKYDTVSRKGNPRAYTYSATGISRPFLETHRVVHWTTLENLEPDTTYYFVAGDDVSGFSEEKKFRTLPSDGSRIRMVVGGDMGTGLTVKRLHKLAAKESPHVALLGGDLAYVNANLDESKKWDRWLEHWEDYMVTPSGHMIPMILAIGNHETPKKKGIAPFYLRYFAQSDHPKQKTYFVRMIGRDTIVFVLDSDHYTSSGGRQTRWLKAMLEKHKDVKNKIALYHVPMYPSFRPFKGSASKRLRKRWLPLFDQYGMSIAFENHDHMYKRSKPLKRNKVVKKGGTLYIGDGCWGIFPRFKLFRRSYIRKSKSRRHFVVVDQKDRRFQIRAIDLWGSVIDRTRWVTP